MKRFIKRSKELFWFIKFWKNYYTFVETPMFVFMEWHTKNMIKDFESCDMLLNQKKRTKELKIFNELVRRYNKEDYGFWHDEDLKFKDPFNDNFGHKRFIIKENENWDMLIKYLSKARRWWI